MTRVQWLLWELYLKWFVSRKTRSYWILKEANKPGETRCKKVLGPIRKIRFIQSTLRQASIREKKGRSLGKIQVKFPHQRSLYAISFKDRSQEENERQQRCAQARHGILPKTSSSSKKWTRLHSSRPRKKGSSYSGACMRMVSKEDLNSAKLDTMRSSRNPTTVMTANGENFLISEVPTLWNLRTDLKKRLKDKSDAPAETRGDWPRISWSSKKRTKLHSIRLPKSGCCRPYPP